MLISVLKVNHFYRPIKSFHLDSVLSVVSPHCTSSVLTSPWTFNLWVSLFMSFSCFSHVTYFARWDWKWRNRSVKYMSSCKIAQCPSSFSLKSWQTAPGSVLPFMTRHKSAHEVPQHFPCSRTRCDVSSGPDHIGAKGCEVRNSFRPTLFVGREATAVFAAGCRQLSLSSVTPKIQLHPLRHWTIIRQYIWAGQPQYWWPTASTKTDVKTSTYLLLIFRYLKSFVCFIRK